MSDNRVSGVTLANVSAPEPGSLADLQSYLGAIAREGRAMYSLAREEGTWPSWQLQALESKAIRQEGWAAALAELLAKESP